MHSTPQAYVLFYLIAAMVVICSIFLSYLASIKDTFPLGKKEIWALVICDILCFGIAIYVVYTYHLFGF